MGQPALDREMILQTIRSWPPTEQIALLQEILDYLRRDVVMGVAARSTAASEPGTVSEPPMQRGSLRNLVGLLATDQPPPTDEEVERWLDEHRMEKYGR
jgi:hypothetical protein